MSVRFAAQDHRAGESEPQHSRDSKSTFSKQMKHSSWVVKKFVWGLWELASNL